jgi:hypothetical protein
MVDGGALRGGSRFHIPISLDRATAAASALANFKKHRGKPCGHREPEARRPISLGGNTAAAILLLRLTANEDAS